MTNQTFAILGAGSWGTAVAIHMAYCGHKVLLWGRDAKQMQLMQKTHENTRYLPGVSLPNKLIPTAHLQDCLDEASHIIVATPSHAFKAMLEQLPDTLSSLAWITKGVEPQTNVCLSTLVEDKYGKDFPMAIISGPSFAKEVANHLPTAIVVAGNNENYTSFLQTTLHHNGLRVYASHDLIGVQCAGAVKNVLAIACGVSDGLGFGANARAALITRGLHEMSRLGVALGGHAETFTGLAGLGDLVLTCTDNQSRNRRFGLYVGEGQSIVTAEKNVGQVVEGKHNAAQVCALAASHQLTLPICHEVHQLLEGNISPKQAVQNLLQRPVGEEF